jgi:outer membrane lipase/esterase
MRKFRPTLVAAALALGLVSGTASAQFTNTYIFGDSLSDAGQYRARFTTNPGLVTPMYVAQSFGLATPVPSFVGGLDYAQGGARVNSPSPLVPVGVPDFSVAQQVNQQLAKTPFLDPNALYQIQGGANDIFVLANQFLNGQITQTQLQAGVAQAATDLAAQVVKLRAAGAQYIILQALPDIGKTPMARELHAEATFTALSQLFNNTLNTAIGSGNVQVLQFPTATLLNEIVANPGLFGFVNATNRVCDPAVAPSALMCTPATLVPGGDPLTWVFADGVHPTTGADLLLTQAIVSMITGPQQMAALGQAPNDVERANWRTLDSRMMSGINAPGPAGRFQAWAAYDYAKADISGASLSGNGDINTVAVGADYRFTDRLLAGIQFAYSDYDGDFGNGGGDFKLREPMLTLYGGYGQGPWYVGATLGAGSLDIDTNRNIALGATTRTESGTTRGYHNVARLLGGYWFKYGTWDHGPFAKLTWEKIVVRQFSENGSDSTALTYGQQKSDTTWSSIGWQVAGNMSGWRPFARATWEYNFDAGTPQVSAKSNTLNGWYVVPGFAQDDNWWLFDVGVSREFGGVTGFVAGNASASKSDGNYWSVTVGIRVPL